MVLGSEDHVFFLRCLIAVAPALALLGSSFWLAWLAAVRTIEKHISLLEF
jgi:hypothetical protein